MNVAEIKAKLPEADVYEIDPNARYILVVNKNEVSLRMGKEMANSIGSGCLLFFVYDTEKAVRILELKE